MTLNVLVAYATKYGATGDIADRIGETIQATDFQVDVSNVSDVENLGNYDAVVLGSAVYIGGWHKEAARFLMNNSAELAAKRVWLYSSGPLGEGDPVDLLDGWHFPEKLKQVAESIQPEDIAVFHGKIDVNKLNFLEKFMLNNIKSPVGDFRDWEMIYKWAEGIAYKLSKDVQPGPSEDSD